EPAAGPHGHAETEQHADAEPHQAGADEVTDERLHQRSPRAASSKRAASRISTWRPACAMTPSLRNAARARATPSRVVASSRANSSCVFGSVKRPPSRSTPLASA